MTQIKLNKSSLSLEQKNLRNYKQFLPSLDLKRQKLLIEKNKSQAEYDTTKQQLDEMEKTIYHNYPMIANTDYNFDQLVKIESTEMTEENIVGVKLPVLNNIKFTISEYCYFNSPPWMDMFLADLQKLIEIHIRIKIANEKVQALGRAAQIVTQRKNLFEKVLIPKARENIRLIQIFLADNERAGVVRSKLAKRKRLSQ